MEEAVIELSPNTALMLYLLWTIAWLLGLWGFHHYRSKEKTILPDEQELFVCEYCRFVYLDDGYKKVTQCPQCLSFNKNNLFSGKEKQPKG